MKKPIIIALCSAIALQFFVLSGMYIQSVAPLWTGTEVKIKTVPVDPRSLFRGNYARLAYDISTISVDNLPSSKELRNGEVVYVSISKSATGLFEFIGASLTEPEQGLFIKGRIGKRRANNSKRITIKYGIEAFFAPKDKALALEKTLRSNAVAILMISADGKARLKEVVAQNSEITG